MHPPKSEFPVEGWPRPYMRDGVTGLSIERQREMLAALGLDMSDDSKLYIDRLSRRQIDARAPLKMRDEAVSPPHTWQRGETVYVAGLRVLGWDNLDVLRATAKAFERDCRICAADTGAIYTAGTPALEMVEALARAEEARRRARTARAQEGQLGKRAARLREGLAIARKLWAGPLTVDKIAEEAGLSTRTLYVHLPPRSEAREEKSKHA